MLTNDARIGRFLQLAERSTALTARVTPSNFLLEKAEVLAAWKRNTPRNPVFVYSAAALPTGLLSALEELVLAPASSEFWQGLFQARARELLLEARMAEVVGTPSFAGLAQQRYGCTDPELERAATELASEWISLPEPVANESLHVTDDLRDPLSLGFLMSQELGRKKLPFRLFFMPELASLAAVGDGIVVVRSGISLRPSDALRVVVHEVSGHALPRHLAQQSQVPLCLVGSAFGSEDEEGRALLLEARAGHLSERRQRQLASRHLAVLAMRAGADWVEAVRKLVDFGMESADAVEVACRAFRGGGWGREQIYLPAYLRVRRGLAAAPKLEFWMERGRIGVATAQLLEASPLAELTQLRNVGGP